MQFTVTATDPESKPLTLSAVLGNGSPLSTMGANYIDHGNGSGTFQWTPAIGQTGNTVVFSAADTEGATNTFVMLISVTKIGIGQPAANLITQLRSNSNYANSFYNMYGLIIPPVNAVVSAELSNVINGIVSSLGYNQTKFLRDLVYASSLLSSLRSSLLWSNQFKTIYSLSIPLDGTLNLTYQDNNTLYEFFQPGKIKKKSVLNGQNNALYSLTFDLNGNPQDLSSGAGGPVSLNVPSVALSSLSIGAGVNITLTDTLSESELRFFSSNLAPLTPLRSKLFEIVEKSNYSLSTFLNSLANEADAASLLQQLQLNPTLANHFNIMYGLTIPTTNAIVSSELHNVLIAVVANYSYDQTEYLRVLPLASNLLIALRSNLTWANQFKIIYGLSIPLDGGLGLNYTDDNTQYEFFEPQKLKKKGVLNAQSQVLYSLTFDLSGNPRDLTSALGVTLKVPAIALSSISIGAGVNMILTDDLNEVERRFFSANIAPLSPLRTKIFEITGDSDYNQTVFLNSLSPAPVPMANITVPANFQIKESSSQQVNLSWNPSRHSIQRPLYYKVFRSFDGKSFSVIGVTKTTSYTDNGFRHKKLRYYKIKAFDAQGRQSAFTEAKRVSL